MERIIEEYQRIAGELGLDTGKDLESAKRLDELLKGQDTSRIISRLKGMLGGKTVYVYGCGPSLKRDIRSVKGIKAHRMKENVHIAADGATRALLEEGIHPDVIETDLDGWVEPIQKSNRQGTLTVVHAHADNIDKINDVVPNLECANVLGSTQTKPFGRLQNYGGFTDGDRAVYLAEHMKAQLIILAGMDFGSTIGEYSGEYTKDKVAKLAIGKRLIENLANNSSSGILNLTAGGEQLSGVPRIRPESLKQLY